MKNIYILIFLLFILSIIAYYTLNSSKVVKEKYDIDNIETFLTV